MNRKGFGASIIMLILVVSFFGYIGYRDIKVDRQAKEFCEAKGYRASEGAGMGNYCYKVINDTLVKRELSYKNDRFYWGEAE